MRDMVGYKDIYIQYIRSEENPAEITKKKTLEAYLVNHTESITEG